MKENFAQILTVDNSRQDPSEGYNLMGGGVTASNIAL